MNISWLTLRDLQYLAAVADEQHFGKAAIVCHVSQPALSAQIKKIEDFLGITLFERSNRRVVITSAGEKIVAQAKVVLEEAQKIVELAKGMSKPLSGNLRLGAIATLGPYFLPYLLVPIRKQYPEVKLMIKEGLTDNLISDLRTGKLDAVLAAPTFSTYGLKTFPLFIEPFILAAPKSHPLIKKSSLKAKDLNAEEMVLLEDGHCLKDQTLELCPANRRGGSRISFQATSLETLRQLVAAGNGYTLLPQLAIESHSLLNNLIQYRKFNDSSMGRTIILVCRENFASIADIEALVQFIKSNLPKGMLPSK